MGFSIEPRWRQLLPSVRYPDLLPKFVKRRAKAALRKAALVTALAFAVAVGILWLSSEKDD